MTINQMKYFIETARCLSFTEAAKHLFITQPALSRQILAMEEELNVQLFVRDKKHVKLTPGGVILYNKLPDILKDYEDTIESARNANQGYVGKIRVGFLDVYDVGILFPDIIKEFRDKYHNIELSMTKYSVSELPKKIYRNELDLIITYDFSLLDKPDLITVEIQKYDTCLMLNKNHKLANKKDLVLEDLKEDTFISLGQNEDYEAQRFMRTLYERAGFQPIIKTVTKMEDVMLWVKTANAVAITSTVSTDRLNPDIVVHPVNYPDAKGHIVYAAWKKDNYNPAISLFMEMVEKKLGRE